MRALAVHPLRPEIVYAGTQAGPYRSADRGEHWEKVDVPDHRLPVWSILFHPYDPDVMFVGYENCEIYRSDDAGETGRVCRSACASPRLPPRRVPIRRSGC